MNGRLKLTQDLVAGLFFLLLGIGALIIAYNYAPGTASRFGPGMAPRIFSWCLIVGGAIILGRAILAGSEAIDRLSVRPIFWVTLAVVVFGLVLGYLGLVLTTLVCTVIGRMAEPGLVQKWTETAIVAVVLALLGIFAFVRALELPIPLWPSLS